MPSGDAHRSLARALDILELCSLNGSGYTLTQLSQHLGIAKGSISPLLHTLRDRGYLTLDDQDHHYRIGRMAVPHSYLLMVASVTLSLSARVFCFMCASFLSSFNSVPK